jgi:hypothetical protein
MASGIALDTPPRPDPGLDWPAIVDRARASNDDHVIKLVHSCREEAAVHGEGARRHAAALAVAG